jgi:hypothetical protein
MTVADWSALSQIIYNIAASAAALGTVVAAIWALVVYKRNSRLERVRWASRLYEKFYERDQLKKVRDDLDCEANSEQISGIVLRQEAAFTDYLNFFEYVAFLEYSKQLKQEEIKDLFGYYLDCLKQHESVRRYIKETGYERLNKLLEKWQ